MIDTVLALAAVLKGGVKGIKLLQLVPVEFWQSDLDRYLWQLVGRYVKQYGQPPSQSVGIDLIKKDKVLSDEDKYQVLANWLKAWDTELKESDVQYIVDELDAELKKYELLRDIEQSMVMVEAGNVDKAIHQLTSSAKTYGIKQKLELPSELLDNEYLLDRFLTRLAQLELEEEYATLIPSLDRILDGGFRKGTLGVVLGATSVGKTMFLVYLASAFRVQGARVLFLSLEDTKEKVEERFDALLFGDKQLVDFQWILQRKQMLDRFGGQLYVEYSAKCSIRDVELYLQKYMQQLDGLDVLIIDYGDLLVGGGGSKDYYLEAGLAFQDLMHIAERWGVVLVTASQANREALRSKAITLAHVGQSFKKVQVAHYVLALSASPEEEQQNQMRIIVLKNKFGRARLGISVAVDRRTNLFKELRA